MIIIMAFEKEIKQKQIINFVSKNEKTSPITVQNLIDIFTPQPHPCLEKNKNRKWSITGSTPNS